MLRLGTFCARSVTLMTPEASSCSPGDHGERHRGLSLPLHRSWSQLRQLRAALLRAMRWGWFGLWRLPAASPPSLRDRRHLSKDCCSSRLALMSLTALKEICNCFAGGSLKRLSTSVSESDCSWRSCRCGTPPVALFPARCRRVGRWMASAATSNGRRQAAARSGLCGLAVAPEMTRNCLGCEA